MVEQQANNLVGGQRIAAAIHAANAVGIAVCDEANIVWMFSQIGLAAGVVFLDGFWIDAAEENVVRPVQCRNAAGSASQQLFEATGAHSEQRLVREAEPGFRN